MGAEPYAYTVPYNPSIQDALNRLRTEVFTEGAYRGAELNPSSPDEAVEMMEEDGTASILDIQQVSTRPEFFCAAPFSPAELVEYFGSEQPTRADVENSDLFWDELERGQARYVVAYENSTPTAIRFVGYSFD